MSSKSSFKFSDQDELKHYVSFKKKIYVKNDVEKTMIQIIDVS